VPEAKTERVVDRLIGITEGLPQVLRAGGTRTATRPNWTFAIAEKRVGRPDPGEIQRPGPFYAISVKVSRSSRHLAEP
jgi:hypothetical protein